jgi:hypothetical protein
MRFKSSNNLLSLMKQVDNPKLSINERNLITWLMDQGLNELTTRETHQLMTWPVRLNYSKMPKKNGRILLPGEEI